MASDFETVIAKCDGCKYEEECREMPPCILDAYNKGRADIIDELADYIKKHFRIGVNTIDDVVKEFKEQNNA